MSKIIEQLIPSLQVVGLFDLFEPIYWIGNGEQPGRVLVVILYFKAYPEKCTPLIRKKLLGMKDQFHSTYLKQQIESLSLF